MHMTFSSARQKDMMCLVFSLAGFSADWKRDQWFSKQRGALKVASQFYPQSGLNNTYNCYVYPQNLQVTLI